jgi:hypothetical protein
LGVAEAQVDLGVGYLVGQGGLQKDPVAAVGWFQKAAAQKNRMGQVYLADAYRDGNGIAPDAAKARALYNEVMADTKTAISVMARDGLAKLDGSPSPSSNLASGAPRPITAPPRTQAAAPPRASAPQPSGNYWPDIPDDPFGGNGGFIRPSGNDSPSPEVTTQTAQVQQAPANTGAQQSRTQQGAGNVPPPSRGGAAPQRPAQSPLVRSSQSSSQQLSPAAILGLGFAALVVTSLLFGGKSGSSDSNSSSAGLGDYHVNTLGGTGIFGQDCTPGSWGCVPYDMQVH